MLHQFSFGNLADYLILATLLTEVSLEITHFAGSPRNLIFQCNSPCDLPCMISSFCLKDFLHLECRSDKSVASSWGADKRQRTSWVGESRTQYRINPVAFFIAPLIKTEFFGRRFLYNVIGKKRNNC